MSRAPSQLPQPVLNWLYNVLGPEYKHVQKTYSDVVQLLLATQSLRPRTNVYTDEAGRSQLLLKLYGTLPSQIQGQTYHFPLEIWIPKEYPELSPFVYITPTNDMVIRPSNYVDPNGKVYHPYISNWAQNVSNNTSCNIFVLFSYLKEAFSKEPPVIAKPPNTSSNATNPANVADSAPPLPPHPTRPSVVLNRPKSTSAQSLQYTQSPPLRPPLPLQLVARQDSDITPLSPRSQKPVSPPHIVQHNYAAPPYQAHPEQPRDIYESASYQRGAQKPLSQQQSVQTPWQMQTSTMNQSVVNQPPIVVQPDLLDQQGTTAPPIPPNPERMRLLESISHALVSISREHHSEIQSQNQSISAVENAVSTIGKVLERESSDLQQLGSKAESNISMFTERIDLAKDVIKEAKETSEPKLDDILCAETAVFSQLYDLVAEDHAIEDTIYILGKAYEHGEINLDIFMKKSRSLAREQFMKRALTLKIAEKLELN